MSPRLLDVLYEWRLNVRDGWERRWRRFEVWLMRHGVGWCVYLMAPGPGDVLLGYVSWAWTRREARRMAAVLGNERLVVRRGGWRP